MATRKAAVGRKVPDLELDLTSGRRARLSDFRGRNLVLYFYPRDNTPGCTREGQEFRDAWAGFRGADTDIIGVSRDSLASHEKFRSAQGFPFELASDPDGKLCAAFDVIREKSMYGRTYLGIDRSTFVIDDQGVLRREFRGVKVKGHVDEVLDAVRNLSQ